MQRNEPYFDEDTDTFILSLIQKDAAEKESSCNQETIPLDVNQYTSSIPLSHEKAYGAASAQPNLDNMQIYSEDESEDFSFMDEDEYQVYLKESDAATLPSSANNAQLQTASPPILQKEFTPCTFDLEFDDIFVDVLSIEKELEQDLDQEEPAITNSIETEFSPNIKYTKSENEQKIHGVFELLKMNFQAKFPNYYKETLCPQYGLTPYSDEIIAANVLPHSTTTNTTHFSNNSSTLYQPRNKSLSSRRIHPKMSVEKPDVDGPVQPIHDHNLRTNRKQTSRYSGT